VKKGRLLAESDREGSPPVVVINESMARTYFPDRNPLGERIQLGTEPDPSFPTMEIVGIVSDVKQSFEAGSKSEMFVPYGQYPDPILAGMYMNVALVVRTTQDPLGLAGSIRQVINEVNPDQPLVNVRTMEGALAGTVAQPRLQLLLVLVFAGVALALAGIGVYGVMAYTVSQRIQEIGIRMAIGASPDQVIRMIVGDGARMALFGIVIGLVAAAMAAAAIRSLLFQVEALDPATFLAAPLVLGVVALLASYIPARRAAKISPMTALS
jgi:putative ABC transport system permease protein